MAQLSDRSRATGGSIKLAATQPSGTFASLSQSILAGLGFQPPYPDFDFAESGKLVDLLAANIQATDRNSEVAKVLAATLGGPVAMGCSLPQSLLPNDPDALYLSIGQLPAKNWTTAVSSRMGRNWDKQSAWLDALRTYFYQISSEQALLTSLGQLTFPFLNRLAELNGVSVCVIEQTTPDRLPAALDQIRQVQSRGIRDGQKRIFRIVTDRKKFVLPDKLCALHCRELRVLHVRPGGNIAGLLDGRLADQSNSGQSRTFILRTQTRKPSRTIASLLKRGALEWQLLPAKPDNDPMPEVVPANRRTSIQILTLADFGAGDFVAHFTRRPRRAWLEESESDYLDSLLLGRDRERSPLMALWRILEQQTLLANNQLTRDATRVVCFTAIPLSAFGKTRTFRSHLARWDFEPYGIAIRRDAFALAGGRAVTYGDDETWARMKRAERAFFQLKQGRQVDWSREKEWRIVGDLSLRQFARGDVVAFVGRLADADFIAPVCRWPIVVLDCP